MQLITMKNWYRAASRANQCQQYWKSLLQRLVSVVKFIAERGLTFRDDENVGLPRNFFQAKFSEKGNAMLLVTGFATVSQITNHYQLSSCITKFCYTWVNKWDVTRLLHQYQWSVEILVTSSAIPYLRNIYPIGTYGLRDLPPSKSGAGLTWLIPWLASYFVIISF